MAHYSVQHVPVAQRVTETGDIGAARHIVGLSTISNKVPMPTRMDCKFYAFDENEGSAQ